MPCVSLRIEAYTASEEVETFGFGLDTLLLLFGSLSKPVKFKARPRYEAYVRKEQVIDVN